MPTVNVRLFAGLREMIGQREITLALPEGATVRELRACIEETYPLVKPFLPTIVCAVGEEYVPISHLLREGDRVALIPPVSGGS
jgi:molybdopterin converting factor subunit 1